MLCGIEGIVNTANLVLIIEEEDILTQLIKVPHQPCVYNLFACSYSPQERLSTGYFPLLFQWGDNLPRLRNTYPATN